MSSAVAYEKPKGSGIWYVRVTHRGQRRSKKVGRRDVAEEAAELLNEKLALGELGILDRSKDTTFAQLAERWLHDYIKQTCARSTYERYQGVLSHHVLPVLGKVPIASIKRSDVRDLLLAIGQRLSYSSVCLARDVCSGVFHFALDEELIEKNPLAGVTKQLALEKKRKKQVGYFRPAEIEQFLAAAAGQRLALFFFVAFRTGMRLGELCGLRWEDVDFERRVIQVSRSFRRGEITGLKTSRSRRDIDMSAQLVSVLRTHRGLGGYVFVNDKGEPYAQNSVRNVFVAILKSAGLPARRVHDIRHTFASVLLSSGASPQYVQRQMGHASIKITVDTYGHMIPGSNAGAIEAIDTFGTNHAGPQP